MPFDFKAEIEKHFPKPKAGEWVPCEYGLPDEFASVMFLIDDGSVEGRYYFGYREENSFRALYMEHCAEPFPIGGHEGVGFWMLVPELKDAFADRA
jgi:hypothetical protein